MRSLTTPRPLRIAFVSANRERLPDAVIPLGLLYVMASCPARHEKVLWDVCFEPDPLGALRAWLVDFEPDIVAVGLRNLQSNDYSGAAGNLAWYGDLLSTIRAVSQATVVIGGGAFSVAPVALMDALRPDYGIAGEGEHAFPQLVDALAAGEQGPEGIPGLHRWRSDRVLATPPSATFIDLNRLPAPDRSLLDPRYFERDRTDSLQTRRGCPMHCTYCTYPQIEGRAVRLRDPEAVAGELLQLQVLHPGVAHVFVVDAVFNLPPSHARAVCEAFRRRGSTLPWTCYVSPIGFTDALAEAMAAAHCAGAEIGSDSGSDEVLLRLRKGFDTARIRAASAIARRAGLKDCHTFLLGTRGETLDDVQRSLDFISDLDPFAAILMVWRDDEEDLGAAAAPRRAHPDDVLARIASVARHHPRWIVPPLNRRFDARLFRLLRRRGLRGPLWQHIDRAGA